MKKTNKVNSHDFHIVLTKDLKMKISSLSIILNKSLSDTAVYIIDRSINFFKKIHFIYEESLEFSNYQNIDWDDELHIYFNKNKFRMIKHLTYTHMAFSIAIVIRWLFNYYFNNLFDEKTMKENDKEIGKMDNEIQNLCSLTKKWNKNIEKKQLSGKFYYQLIFNDKFSLTGFNFIQSG